MRHRIGYLLSATTLGVVAALALPSLASAATTCNFGVIPTDPTPTLVVDHTGGIDDITIRRVPLPAEVRPMTKPVSAPVTTAAMMWRR